MKRFGNPLLSFSALFLICLASLGMVNREGREKIQYLPAFLVGGGLIISSIVRRNRRRKMLLIELRTNQKRKSL